jgi:hypothetical protein
MSTTQMTLGARLAAAGVFAAAVLAGSPASAHEDPPGCFETGPAIIVSVFRANGTTGVVGTVSECETINYRATLQKASSSDTICAFSQGTFRLTTPDGVVHDINLDVPCIGGTTGEGCDPTVTQLQSNLIPYTVDPGDVVGGFVVATAVYANGVAHDTENNTAGVGANTPKSTPVTLCTDNDLCTTDICDPNVPGSAACSNTPIVCDDNSLCTTEFCNPATGKCVFTPVNCDDNNLCTIDSCNPATGCVNTPVVCNDNNLCTGDACNPATGQCVFTPNVNCDDNNACTTDACIPATGGCSNVDNVTPTCDDNDECTDESCDPATGQCRTDSTTTCDDNDICTDDACDPATGLCVFTPDPTNDPSCQEEAICRTPGYWKTHGAVSQQVINLAGCLEICGEVITTATASSVGNANSVLEAMCIPPRGEARLQLVRQLTAMALNCTISEFGGDCSGDTSLGDLFADCNAACLSNTGVGDCIAAIDCFNNGGLFNETTGLCGENPGGSCHERALPDTLTLGPADTPEECNAASKNQCEVILAKEANCTSGIRVPGPEFCL